MDPTCNPESVGLCPRRLQRVRDWMHRSVDSGRLPCALVAVMRRDELAFFDCHGLRDVAAGTPVTADTVFRIYSMTKPITAVAALMLYEEGCFQLDDPVAAFLPAFAATEVFAGGDAGAFDTVPVDRPITVHDLMTHTAGFTYGFMDESPVGDLYRARGIDFQANAEPLASIVDDLAEVPLLFQPGTRWNYGVSTDVLGRLVEVWSGRTLAEYFEERILGPLGMRDTGFSVPAHARDRFACNYRRGDDGGLELVDAAVDSPFTAPSVTHSGGGGLVSTAGDYLRFARMLARGGELDGVRLLGPKTVELMTSNHLPGDMAAMGQARFSETTYVGIGFGLAVSVMLDPARAQILGTPGEYAWGGAASTAFWVDPAEDQIVLLLTQLTPSSTYPLRRELRVLTYQAIVD